MGKIKRSRSKHSRYNPISVNSKEILAAANCSDNGATGSEANGTKEFSKKCTNGLKVIIEKITSTSSADEEKLTALNTLASLASEDATSEYIMEGQLLSMVASLLTHSNSQVRLASAGALRNLCVAGSDKLIESMVQQDILSPLTELIKKCSNSLIAADTDKSSSLIFSKGIAHTMDDSDITHLIFIQATYLLWSLCECNEDALTIFNREGLVHVLILYVNPSIWGNAIALPVVECLLCVTENNANAISAILPTADSLLSLLSDASVDRGNSKWLLFAVTLSGVLLNINYCTPQGGNLHLILEIFSKSLSLDVLPLLNHMLGDTEAAKTQTNGHQRNSFDNLEDILSSQQLVFEMLSNICCSDDDEDWCEYEDTSEDDMDNEGQMDVVSEPQNTFPVEIIECIKYFQFVENTAKNINLPVASFNNGSHNSESHKSIIEKVVQLRIRALQCFQNLVSCLDIDELGGSEWLYNIWLQLGKWLCSEDDKDSSFQEAVSGAMRASIDKLKNDCSSCPQLLNFSLEDLNQIFKAISSCSLGSIRVNLARMIGDLGCLIINKTPEEAVTKGSVCDFLTSSTSHLLQVATEDPELFVSAEAIDVVIDLFSDDKTDRLAADLQLIDRLREIQISFKAKYMRMKKKLGDHRPLVLTVKENLFAFIKYKTGRSAKFIQSERMVQ